MSTKPAPEMMSPHFSFLEMTRTSNRKYLDLNRQVPPNLMDAGRALCTTLLEPVREKFGPVSVHSGYRCGPLNRAVGGAAGSQHLKFQAADFHVDGHDLTEIWTWIWRDSGLKFGQLILEGWGGGAPGWIHLSLGAPWRAANNGQVMTMKNGRYTVVRTVK